MERVDVVVVGGGAEALAAAAGAANEGVRVITVSPDPLPDNGRTLHVICDDERQRFALPGGERVLDRCSVDEHSAVGRAGPAELHVFSHAAISDALVHLVRKAGAEIRGNATAVHADLDSDGWHVQLSAGEPIRAPVLIVADGARSRMLETLGIAQAQRFTASAAEVVTFFTATWPDSDLNGKFDCMHVIESAGPMSRIEVVPGRSSVTVAFGPVWHGVFAREADWPSTSNASVTTALTGVKKRLGIDTDPTSMGVAEWRLDALPAPATFDGGLVIGAAAGHRLRQPLSATGHLIAGGMAAGVGAAKCVLDKDWRAGALGQALQERYRALMDPLQAELTLQVHGLRKRRKLAPSFWRPTARA